MGEILERKTIQIAQLMTTLRLTSNQRRNENNTEQKM